MGISSLVLRSQISHERIVNLRPLFIKSASLRTDIYGDIWAFCTVVTKYKATRIQWRAMNVKLFTLWSEHWYTSYYVAGLFETIVKLSLRIFESSADGSPALNIWDIENLGLSKTPLCVWGQGRGGAENAMEGGVKKAEQESGSRQKRTVEWGGVKKEEAK